MKSVIKSGLMALMFVSMFFSQLSIGNARADYHKLKYHSNPNSQYCSWVYQWKWVYGKRVKVKVKVCNWPIRKAATQTDFLANSTAL